MIRWNSQEVIDILKNPNYSLSQMAELIGCKSIFEISRRRRKAGITYRCYGTGLTRRQTNQETKRRYNAKIKEHGWKPIYKW